MMHQSTLLDQTKLQQIHSLLQRAVDSKDSSSQKQVYEHLSSAQQNHEFYIGLLMIASDTSIANNIRQMALITLKNALKRNQDTIQFQPQQLTTIRNCIVNLKTQQKQGLVNAHKNLVSLMALWGKKIDFQILAYLMLQINSQDISRIQFSLQVLKTILQDLRFESQNINCIQKPQFGQFLHSYINSFSSKVSLGHNQLTKKLLQCMNLLIRHSVNLPNSKQIISEYLSIFLIPILSNNSLSDQIILIALDGVMQVLQVDVKAILHNQQVCSHIFGLNLNSNQNSEVTKKWLSLIYDLLDKDNQQGKHIKPYFPILIPKIIMNLQFTKQDEANVKMQMQQQNNPYQYQQQDQDDERDKQHKGFLNYTKRKLSVFILNQLLTFYCEEIWEIIQPIIDRLMGSQHLGQKQSGILLVGIVFSLTEDHLDFLEKAIPIITNIVNDKNMPEIIRCTSLWTVSKMAYLIIREQQLCNNIQKLIVVCLASSDGQVKDAAFSALDQFVRLNETLPPNLNQISLIIIEGIRVCQAKPLYSVLKICSTLYERHSESIPNQITQAMLKQLCGKWANNSCSQSVMSPILECLVTISSAKNDVFRKYALQIFNQIFHILQNQHQKAILLRSIDLLSSIVMMQIPQVTQILRQNDDLHKKVYALATNEENEVRNFTYGLLGDITKVTQFPKYAETYIQTIGNSFNQNSLTSCSNALTCATDIIVAHPYLAANYSSSIMMMASKKMKTNNLQNAYGFNFARIFGRLGYLNPVDGAKMLGDTIQNVCKFLKAHQHHKLTDEAYKGIFKLVQHNPSAAASCFQYLVQAFVCYSCQDKQVQSTFIGLLKSYRNSLNAQGWANFLRKPVFLPAVSKKIQLISSN